MFITIAVGVPVACGIAILKYRLYDLDVVIRKTVVFALLAVFITAVYALIVGLGSQLFNSSALSFVAAAVLAVAFQLVRERARKIADRVVYGQRSTPYEVLSEFSRRVGEAYATEDILGRMAQVLAAGTGAEVATVWLRSSGEIRPAASAPSTSRHPPSSPRTQSMFATRARCSARSRCGCRPAHRDGTDCRACATGWTRSAAGSRSRAPRGVAPPSSDGSQPEPREASP